ncbi:hypothetical protein AB833_22050 [Chromatiales bacterium (ex Bugula neritina AB1)]|nr:hypothetical protein AB833_22050 [Chromatiales bacterium (ex Bugula neritina AB1)]
MGNEKEVILKSILTAMTGILVFASGSILACPFMDTKQKVTELNLPNQTEQSLVANEVEEVDPKLLARLQQDNKGLTN